MTRRHTIQPASLSETMKRSLSRAPAKISNEDSYETYHGPVKAAPPPFVLRRPQHRSPSTHTRPQFDPQTRAGQARCADVVGAIGGAPYDRRAPSLSSPQRASRGGHPQTHTQQHNEACPVFEALAGSTTTSTKGRRLRKGTLRIFTRRARDSSFKAVSELPTSGSAVAQSSLDREEPTSARMQSRGHISSDRWSNIEHTDSRGLSWDTGNCKNQGELKNYTVDRHKPGRCAEEQAFSASANRLIQRRDAHFQSPLDLRPAQRTCSSLSITLRLSRDESLIRNTKEPHAIIDAAAGPVVSRGQSWSTDDPDLTINDGLFCEIERVLEEMTESVKRPRSRARRACARDGANTKRRFPSAIIRRESSYWASPSGSDEEDLSEASPPLSRSNLCGPFTDSNYTPQACFEDMPQRIRNILVRDKNPPQLLAQKESSSFAPRLHGDVALAFRSLRDEAPLDDLVNFDREEVDLID